MILLPNFCLSTRKNHNAHNMIFNTVIWIIWNRRNALCFKEQPWYSFVVVWDKLVTTLN